MKGILLMAYGAPRTLDDVEAYYTHIREMYRGGGKPSAGEVSELTERYRRIGGVSPLIEITENQKKKLQAKLDSAGSSTVVYSGMKHSPPFIADVVNEACNDGIDELFGLVLAPHYSSMSVGTYIQAMNEANVKLARPMKIQYVESWHDNPLLIELWTEKVVEAELKLGGDSNSLVFSAHSLPERILKTDPYKDQLLETSKLVGEKLHRQKWSFCFQSASQSREPWLGPDIHDHLESLYARGDRNFLLAPVGFVADHLEILYDIDIECKEWARNRGAKLERCVMPNDSSKLIDCLYSIAASKGFG
jgi:ferrochelatase